MGLCYDGDGIRTSTLTTPFDSSGNPLTASLSAYYFGGAYETRSNGSIFKYYSFGGQSIVNEYKPATSTWTLSYMLTDHLGSVVAITDASGALVSQQRYLPFGGVRLIPNSQSLITDFGYTGQRNLDSNIGLMDYKARFYSPVLNRFIQPDTIVPGMYNPQMLNRFSYVGNNPVNFNDPTGHVRCNEEGECWDGKTKLISNIHTEDFLRDTSDEDDDTGGGCHGVLCSSAEGIDDINCSEDTFFQRCEYLTAEQFDSLHNDLGSLDEGLFWVGLGDAVVSTTGLIGVSLISAEGIALIALSLGVSVAVAELIIAAAPIVLAVGLVIGIELAMAGYDMDNIQDTIYQTDAEDLGGTLTINNYILFNSYTTQTSEGTTTTYGLSDSTYIYIDYWLDSNLQP